MASGESASIELNCQQRWGSELARCAITGETVMRGTPLPIQAFDPATRHFFSQNVNYACAMS